MSNPLTDLWEEKMAQQGYSHSHHYSKVKPYSMFFAGVSFATEHCYMYTLPDGRMSVLQVTIEDAKVISAKSPYTEATWHMSQHNSNEILNQAAIWCTMQLEKEY